MDEVSVGTGAVPGGHGATTAAPQTPTTFSDIVDKQFVCGVDGFIKVTEMVFSLVTFICASVWSPFIPLGGGWVQFVSITAFLLTGFIYLLYTFKMTQKLSSKMPFKFTELCYYATFSLFYFIAGIVSAVNASKDGAVVAATVFSFLSLVVFGVDVYLRFTSWRHSSEGPFFSSMASTFTSSSATTETPTSQY